MAETISRHASERASQRNLSHDDLAFVMQYGQEIHRAGALFIFLGHRHIPKQFRGNRNIMRLAGTALVVSSDCQQVITAYRNRNAIRDIKRKSKRYIPKGCSIWH